jgi:hypothetical protein
MGIISSESLDDLLLLLLCPTKSSPRTPPCPDGCVLGRSEGMSEKDV